MIKQFHFSFDDGNISDIRAGELLKKYGFTGVFYYPSRAVTGQQLSLKELLGLYQSGHEIGGHTLSHPPDIKLLPYPDLYFDINNNKRLIEDLITKKKITKFAYPRGRHNELVRDTVKQVGFTEARTTLVLHVDNPFNDPFRTPTTIQMRERKEYNGVHWFDMALQYLKIADEKNGFFHLWGHTHELDVQGDWGKFEEILKIIKEKYICQ